MIDSLVYDCAATYLNNTQKVKKDKSKNNKEVKVESTEPVCKEKKFNSNECQDEPHFDSYT